MKRIWLYLLILISPFLFIVLINETVSYDQKSYVIESDVISVGKKIDALNTDKYLKNACTWYCHNNGCKHKSVIYQGKIQEMYDAIIHFNQHQSLDYSVMNVFLFVIVVPLMVYILIIINIEVYLRNKKKRIS
jgi:hypothetical protein